MLHFRLKILHLLKQELAFCRNVLSFGLKNIIKQISEDLRNKKVWVESRDNCRVYTDGTKSVVMTTADETAQMYYKTFMNIVNAKTITSFDNLPRCTIYVGQPDTGKTYQAQQVAQQFNGGGHKFASGARIKTEEEVNELFAALDELCKEQSE